VVDKVLEKLVIRFEKPGERIISQGQQNTNFFFVGKGFVETYKVIDKLQEFYIQTFEANQMFGEISALLGCNSDVSFVCRNYCKIACLDITEYNKIELVRPQMRNRMLQLMKRQLSNPINSFFLKRVDRMEIFKSLSPTLKDTISFHMMLNKYNEGDVIVNPQDQC